jgi:hypothetical protein
VAVAKNKLLSRIFQVANRYVIGQSIDIVKLYQKQGVNPQTGLYDFVDLNGDGSITAATSKLSRTYLLNILEASKPIGL